MGTKRRWVAVVAAALGIGLSGCQTWVGGMTLPSPRYLEHYPQYFPADPAFPLPRELANQINPAGPTTEPTRIGVSYRCDPPQAIGVAIGASAGLSVPPMVPPPPLPASAPAIPRAK